MPVLPYCWEKVTFSVSVMPVPKKPFTLSKACSEVVVSSHLVTDWPVIFGPQLSAEVLLYSPRVPCPYWFCMAGRVNSVVKATVLLTVMPRPGFWRPFLVVMRMTPLPAREP